MRRFEESKRNPLYQDVVRGHGGLSGLFTFNQGDTLIDTSYDSLIDSDGSFIVQTTDGARIQQLS